MINVLIFAGGVGARMKSKEIPKQFLTVEGKPIIIHTLENFSNHNMVDNIVVVCLESWIDELKYQIEKYSVKKVVGIIPEVFIAAEQAHRLITELIEVPDLMARKRKMIEAGDAFLILPGGFGTLEEFADTAVHYHIYTEETNRPPIIIANIEGIYDPLRALFENWKSAEFITANEWENIHFINSIKELLPLLP